MKKSLAAVSAVATLASAMLMAAPAQAYDQDAYVYAAGHMLTTADVPASLGDFGTNMSFYATQNTGKLYLCYVGDKDVAAKGGKATYSASFNESAKDAAGNSLGQSVMQYGSAEKAIAAFDVVKERIKKCTGTTTQTWPGEDGSSQTSSSLTTNGTVPMVTEVGVESVFVNQNYLTTSSDGADKYSSDTYTVYTLLNDTILWTSYTTGNLENIPTKQRKQVNEVAFTAIDRWLG